MGQIKSSWIEEHIVGEEETEWEKRRATLRMGEP